METQGSNEILDDVGAIELSKEEMDTVINWMDKILEDDSKANLASEPSSSENGQGLTLEEHENQILLNLIVYFKSGCITLTDTTSYSIKFFQQDLNIDLKVKNNSTFHAEITNKTVGIAIETYDLNENGEIVNTMVKQVIAPV